MAKHIPGRYANEGFFAYLRRLTSEFPQTSSNVIRQWATATTRIRSSSYKRHQGEQEKARRVSQMACGILRFTGA